MVTLGSRFWRRMRLVGLVVVLIVGVFIYREFSPKKSPVPQAVSRSAQHSTQSQVSNLVKVQVTPEYIDRRKLSGFRVLIETTQNQGYLTVDMTDLAMLGNEKGETVIPKNWVEIRSDDYQREGILIFPAFESRPKDIELTVYVEDPIQFKWRL